MKWFIYFIFIILFLGVTFFGLGPVLMADGAMHERVLTFGIVMVLYGILTGLLMFLKNKFRY